MSTTKSPNLETPEPESAPEVPTPKLPKKPIYPPERNRAIIQWIAAFIAFLVAAISKDLLLITVMGIILASTSAHLGEQLYKENVYKEILYYRALSTMIDIKDMEDTKNDTQS